MTNYNTSPMNGRVLDLKLFKQLMPCENFESLSKAHGCPLYGVGPVAARNRIEKYAQEAPYTRIAVKLADWLGVDVLVLFPIKR